MSVQTAGSTSGVTSGFSGAPESTGIQKQGNVASFALNAESSYGIDTYGNKYEVPDLVMKDILKAIPSKCFERSAVKSMYYVVRDVFFVVLFGYLANNYICMLPNSFLRTAAWTGYIIMQGFLLTGIWVIAHECGHQAFSESDMINDTVGWILHSYLMVPYFSWKYSHGQHHKATGHMSRDTVFVPKRKEDFMRDRGIHDVEDIVGDSPLYSLYSLVAQQLGGWVMYLCTNVTGQKYPEKSYWGMCHFNPSSVLFEKRQYNHILLSDLGLVIQLGVLYQWYKTFGGFNVLVNWFLPYLLVNHWLVFITFLQHYDPSLPHYEAEQWSFARGAACTIDREFGFVGKYLFHDIIETHVLHHFCSKIPHYNAREASAAIKKVLGKAYKHTDENMWVSLWKSYRWCQFVEGEDGVLMYRNFNGNGVKPRMD